MFDDYAGRLLEHGDTPDRGIGVREIVIREFFALKLLNRTHPTRSFRCVRVEGGYLMRILTVPEIAVLIECQRQFLWKRVLREIVRNDRIIGSGMSKRFRSHGTSIIKIN